LIEIYAGVAIGIATLAVWGIGNTCRSLCCMKSCGSWTVTAGLGLAAVIALGGLLNLLQIAYAPMLWFLIAIGLSLAAVGLKRIHITITPLRENRLELILAVLLIAGVIGFAIFTQLSPSAFNYHDDFQKYFAHPVRMLATGTLSGSPLTPLGSETLGGQAFLQAFVLSIAPIKYINAVDAIFCLFILMGIGAAAGWQRFALLPGAVLAPALIAAVNPQYVNVGGLYSAAALIATAVMLVAHDKEAMPPAAACLGLVYAALTTIKATFAFFILLHLPLAAAVVWWSTNNMRFSAIWAVKVGAYTCLALLPWVGLYISDYVVIGSLRAVSAPALVQSPVSLFSTQSLY